MANSGPGATVPLAFTTKLSLASIDPIGNDLKQALLDYANRDNRKVELRPFLELSALTAWPQGRRGEDLRLAALHRQRDDELEKIELDRDYVTSMRDHDYHPAETYDADDGSEG